MIVALVGSPVAARAYNALDGVKQVKTVFDITLGAPKTANVVF